MSAEGKPVLIDDVSIWIELLRHPTHALRPLIDNLIAEDQARLCAAVSAELTKARRPAKDLSAAEDLTQAIPILEGEDKIWMDAGRLAQKLRSKGVIVGLLDCYLASIALAHDCAILSLDKHFSLIAKHSLSLELSRRTAPQTSNLKS